jgi:hypothetical protein
MWPSVFAQDAEVILTLKKEAVTMGDGEKAKLGKMECTSSARF